MSNNAQRLRRVPVSRQQWRDTTNARELEAERWTRFNNYARVIRWEQ